MELIVENARAYCYTGGKMFDPALPYAVFLHGAQNDHSVWALHSRYFAHHGFNVLALDLLVAGDWSVPPRILICGSLYLAGEILAANGTPPD